MNLKTYWSLWGLFLLFFLTACTKESENKKQTTSKDASNYEGPVVKNDWHVYWLSANPSSLNPVTSSDTYSSSVTSSIFDTLVYFDPMTGKPRGRAATHWEVSKDGLQYDFFLRQGMKFHDGKPVTAEDVKFSYDIIQNPKVDAAHLQNYFADLEKVEIVSEKQIRITMKKPYFRNIIVLGLVEILPKHIYGEGNFNTNPAGRAPVGSGPYRFEKWDQGRLIELSRFKDYWGNTDNYFKNRFNFNRLLYRVITERNVASLSLKKGEIDSMTPTAKQYLEDFSGKEFEKDFYRLQYSTADGAGYGFIGWNLTKEIFQSKNIRRALAMMMPREEVNKKIYQGMRDLSVGVFPQESPKSSPDLKPIAFDPQKAKKLLIKEGWTPNENEMMTKNGQLFEFDLLFTAQTEENQRIALIYQQSLRKLGIKLNIKTLEWTVFIKNVREGKFDAAMLGWGSSLDSDPYQIWHSSQAGIGGSNFVGYKNEKVDRLLEKARKTLDRKKRNQLYRQFSEIIAEDAPYLFLFERPQLFITSKRFAKVLPVGKLGVATDRFFTPPDLVRYQAKAQTK